MAKCEQCNGSNYDEWWMCADCYRSISFKELEQLKREYFEAGRKLTDRSAPTMDGFFIGGSQVKYTTLEDYEAQRLSSKKDSHE